MVYKKHPGMPPEHSPLKSRVQNSKNHYDFVISEVKVLLFPLYSFLLKKIKRNSVIFI